MNKELIYLNNLENNNKKFNNNINNKDVFKKLNIYCIDVLLHYLNSSKFPSAIFPEEFKKLSINKSVFVTWLNLNSNDYRRRLRGCIGSFYPDDLEKQLYNYTLVSALNDNRFEKVNNIKELLGFEMSVSLLKEFKSLDNDIYNWELGKEGVYLSFTKNNKDYNSCYLPEVPIIDNWDKKLTLNRCIKKSGYTSDLNLLDELQSIIKVDVFKSNKSSITIKEYINIKGYNIEDFYN